MRPQTVSSRSAQRSSVFRDAARSFDAASSAESSGACAVRIAPTLAGGSLSTPALFDAVEEPVPVVAPVVAPVAAASSTSSVGASAASRVGSAAYMTFIISSASSAPSGSAAVPPLAATAAAAAAARCAPLSAGHA